MSKKSATVLVVFIVAILACGLAFVVAGMVGTYSLNNPFNDDNLTAMDNNTTDTQDSSYMEVPQSSSSQSSNDVKSEDVYVSGDTSESGSQEDSNPGAQGGESEDVYSNNLN